MSGASRNLHAGYTLNLFCDSRGTPSADRSPPGRRDGPAGITMHARAIVALVILGSLAVVAIALVPASHNAPRADVPEPTRTPPPARGISATEITLGMASPFSGANRELGHALQVGIEAAFAEVNASGGVHGRKLRLVAMDDACDPSRTGPVMRQLVEGERVFAVLGNVGTPTAAVAVPYCMEQKVVFFGAVSGGDILRKHPPDRYVFNFRPSYAEETAAAVGYLVDVRRIAPARIAVFAQEDEFGECGCRGALHELEKRGIPAARVLRVGYKRDSDDVDQAVAALKRRGKKLDAVVMVATFKAAANFIHKLRDAGIAVVTTNMSPADPDALAKELVAAGPRYAEGVIVTEAVPIPTSHAPAAVRFREALARFAPGEAPGFLKLEGWLIGQLLTEALRRAGKELDSEKLVSALEEIRDLDLGMGTAISFGPQEHQGSHTVFGMMLQPDGSWKHLDLR